MIDTERLFDSLNQAREFAVTEDHLKLLRHLRYGGLYWDPGEGFGGAPFFGPKKPYGNSDVPGDVARIVGAPDTDWESDEWGDRGLRPEAADRYLRLHVETGIALKIALATGEFRVGRYICTDVWGNDWRRE
jgi:hypothetical protein